MPPSRARFVNILLFIQLALISLLFTVLIWKHPLYYRSWLSGCVFYGPPAVLIFVLVFAFCLPVVRRAKIALAISAGAMALLISEISLHVFAPTWLRTDLEAREVTCAKLGRPFDNRTKRQVIEDYRAAGEAAVPVIPVAILFVNTNQPLQLTSRQIMPLSGISKALSVYGNESGEYLTYQSDEYGFTNPTGAFDSETSELVVVGDSFAHGACVPRGKDSVSLIRQQFPSTINLGYMAGGPLSYLGTLTEYALQKRPRIVLWYHFEGNDFRDLLRERQTLLTGYLQDDFHQGLPDLQAEIDRVLIGLVDKHLQAPESAERSKYSLRQLVMLETLRNFLLILCRPEDTHPHFDPDYLELVLAKAKTRVERGGGELKFVYLPAFERYSGQADLYAREENVVVARMSKLGIPVINLADTFEKHPDPLSFFPLRLNGHYTEEGYALVAQTILNELQSDK